MRHMRVRLVHTSTWPQATSLQSSSWQRSLSVLSHHQPGNHYRTSPPASTASDDTTLRSSILGGTALCSCFSGARASAALVRPGCDMSTACGRSLQSCERREVFLSLQDSRIIRGENLRMQSVSNAACRITVHAANGRD